MLTDMNSPAPETAPVSEPVQAPEWTQSLSEEIRSNETLAKYDSLDNFVADSLKARNDYAALQTQVAVPESYEFQMEGLDQEAVGQYAEIAKEIGLTQAQAQKILEFSKQRSDTIRETQEQLQQQAEESRKQRDAEELTNAQNAFKQEWGASFDKNMALVNRLISKFGEESFTNLLNLSGKELASALGDTRLGNYPAIARTLHKVASQLSEDQFATDGTQQTSSSAKVDSFGRRMLEFPSMQKQN